MRARVLQVWQSSKAWAGRRRRYLGPVIALLLLGAFFIWWLLLVPAVVLAVPIVADHWDHPDDGNGDPEGLS